MLFFTRITDANSSPAFISNCVVIAAREAVVAAVRAAAIGVERPVENGMPLTAVQRGPAGHFLIAGLVGAAVGAGQGGGAAGLDGQRDVACGGFAAAEVEQWHFAVSSPCIVPVVRLRVKRAGGFCQSSSRSSRVWSSGISGCQPSSVRIRVGSPRTSGTSLGRSRASIHAHANRHARARQEAVEQFANRDGAPRTDVVGAARHAAFEDQPVGADRVAHVGEIAARVEVADRDLRLAAARFDVGDAAREPGCGEKRILARARCG